MRESIEARFQVKDENGEAVVDGEGKALWESVCVEYDFGDDLNSATELCGSDAVFSNYKANARVALQSILRAKLKAGFTGDQIQSLVDAWKPGMVIEKTQVDPATAIKNAFATWSPEKKAAFLAELGVQG